VNVLKGKLLGFESKEDIVLAFIECEGEIFHIFMLDAETISGLKPPCELEMLFKENELCFSEIHNSLSVENTFVARIVHIKKGELFWNVSFDFKGKILNSLISAKKGEALKLYEEDLKLCFIKADAIVLRF